MDPHVGLWILPFETTRLGTIMRKYGIALGHPRHVGGDAGHPAGRQVRARSVPRRAAHAAIDLPHRHEPRVRQLRQLARRHPAVNATRALGGLAAVVIAACSTGSSRDDGTGEPPVADSGLPNVVDSGGTFDAGASGPPGGVFVHLFEWTWPDVAAECESFLGPKGYAAVQVSPPSEHAVLAGHPWWQRYQTVGYALDKSRSGTKAAFVDMVQRCAKVGVGIYVDAVLNHMTGQASGVGSNGTAFTKYVYPGLYTQTDFHMPTCTIMPADYATSADHVQNCELVGLADLNTGSASVQGKIADYLVALVRIGVRGFRVDAAKHMAPADLDATVNRV